MIRVRPDRVEAVAADLRERGLTVEPDGRGVVARGDPERLPIGVDAPLAVRPLRDDRPLTAVSVLAGAAAAGRVPVLTGHERALTAARELLGAPRLLAGRRGNDRVFRTVEDRISLPDGTFACVAGRGPLRWRERREETPDADTDGPEEQRRAGADDPPIALSVGGETAAVLGGVDDLTCPGPPSGAFPYRYDRDDDGRFRVFDGDDVVAAFRSVTAMRADGYRPVSLPLVPEHHVRDGGRLARAARLAAVDGDRVRYEAP